MIFVAQDLAATAHFSTASGQLSLRMKSPICKPMRTWDNDEDT